MTEYTVTFQRGRRVGTRGFRMVYIEAASAEEARAKAKAEFVKEFGDPSGYRLARISHFEQLDGEFERLVEDLI